jgi:hypothetical protein
MTGLLELRGVLATLNSPVRDLLQEKNSKIQLLLLAKIDSVTHNNVVTDNHDLAKKLWKAIQERFASSQSSNCA